LAHIVGIQPYTDENTARDNAVVALLTFGEDYHNFHYMFGLDYRNGDNRALGRSLLQSRFKELEYGLRLQSRRMRVLSAQLG
jgi:hypothetical protein